MIQPTGPLMIMAVPAPPLMVPTTTLATVPTMTVTAVPIVSPTLSKPSAVPGKLEVASLAGF